MSLPTFRPMKNAASYFALLVAALAIPAFAAAPPQQTVALRPGALAQWNVVVITLDATSADRIGTYVPAHKTMPYLDSLARQGVVYERAYCTVGETAPSHASILSGATSARHGVSHNGDTLSDKSVWLPELLREQGYFTAGSSIAFFIDRHRGFHRGFDRLVVIPNDKEGRPGAMSTNAVSAAQAETLYDDLAGRGKKPFFYWIHLKGGHGPLTPIEPKYLQKFDRTLPAANLPPALAKAMPGWNDKESFLLADTDRIVKSAYAYYDANVAEADAALQRIIDGFRKRGLAQKTLFVITADHGESFDHGLLQEHGTSPWESTLRIPLILYADSPRLAPARVKDRLVSTLDLAPTLTDLLGTRGSNEFDGVSLLRTRRTALEAASGASLLYDEHLRVIVAGKGTPTPEMKNTLADLERTGNFYWATLSLRPDGRILKMIHYGRRTNTRNRSAFIKLFDVARDPAEIVDLLESGAKVRLTASEMLDDARKRDPLFGRVLSDIADGVLSNSPDAFTKGLSKEAIETLRSLGYLQ
jgi:arylsulfatase A-like enzyme